MTTEMTPAMRRSILIAALRDPTTWPPNFEWDFSRCNACAMGLLMTMHKIDIDDQDYAGTDVYRHRTAKLLGLDIYDVSMIFSTPAWPVEDNISCRRITLKQLAKNSKAYKAVTPQMVADRLEAVHQRIASSKG